MPQVRIELVKGKSREFLLAFKDAVHESMVEVLKLPNDDRNIRVCEFDDFLFDAKPPYEYFIEIILFSGRTADTKRLLFITLVHKLNEKLAIDAKAVFIVLNEQPAENWGIRGGISAADIQFDFKINI